MSTGLIDIMKRAANDANEAGQPCDLRYGTVVSVSPLIVQVSHQLTIPASLLIVPKALTNFTVPVSLNWLTKPVVDHVHYFNGENTEEAGEHLHQLISNNGELSMTIHNGLKVGDNVAMVRQKGGQKYYIAGVLISGNYSGGESGGDSSGGDTPSHTPSTSPDNPSGGNGGSGGSSSPSISQDELEQLIRDTLQEMIDSGEFNGQDGKDGADGKDGKDGIGIASIQQTTTSTEDNGINIITITKTNGAKSTVQVMNGSRGSQGEKGEKGDTGESGVTTQINGFFTLAVDADGNLYVYSEESTTVPQFEYDSETGNLYVVQEQGD